MQTWWNSIESVARLNTVVLACAAVFGFFAAGFVVASWFTGTRLATLQDLELNRYKKDADLRIANANESSAQANERAAEANERAAEANKKAQEEELARVRIDEKLAGWKLNGAAQARLVEKLKVFRETPFDLGANPTEVAFMETLDGILLSAGWHRQVPKGNGQIVTLLLAGKARINYVSGFYVEIAASSVHDLGHAAETLVASLRAEGIPAKGQVSADERDISAIHIVVGSK